MWKVEIVFWKTTVGKENSHAIGRKKIPRCGVSHSPRKGNFRTVPYKVKIMSSLELSIFPVMWEIWQAPINFQTFQAHFILLQSVIPISRFHLLQTSVCFSRRRHRVYKWCSMCGKTLQKFRRNVSTITILTKGTKYICTQVF